MSEVVEAKLTVEARCAQQRLEVPVIQLVTVKRLASGIREHKPVVMPALAKLQALLALPHLVEAQSFHCGGRRWDGAP